MNCKQLLFVLVSTLCVSVLVACATPVAIPAPPTSEPATTAPLALANSAITATREPRLAETRGAETRAAESSPTITPAPLQTVPRRPRGIYAELLGLVIDQQEKGHPSITPAELHTFFKNLYNSLLDNPAVSGLAVGMTWKSLNPSSPSSPQPYDWSYMDDAFASVAAWNAANPTKAPKTIQVQISAGYGTPQWVLDQIPSCDGLFQSPPQKPTSNCGKATFVGFVEGGGGVLPMPWNAFYKSSFKTFLTAFAGRYGANPSFVSMGVSGPTAASNEMILPNNVNTPKQSQFGGITPNDMWLRLLVLAYPSRPAYQKSDQAFIDEWNAAIDMFGEIFSGVTLVATTGSGLPSFSNSGFTVPDAFKEDCPAPDMDCAAEATILSHFVDPNVGGANAKATQSSGMRGLALTSPYNLSLHAAGWLAQSTAQLTAPSAQILAGQQFDTSAALHSVEEGCTSRFPPGRKVEPGGRTDPSTLPVADIPPACLAPGITQSDLVGYKQFGDVPAKDLISPEQALYNVLKNYFDGTPAASFFGGTPGTAPYNYVQIYNEDIKYATAHANAPVQVVEADGTSITMTAQDLLNLASQKLLEIGEPKRSP
jgi:hypothetical protein